MEKTLRTIHRMAFDNKFEIELLEIMKGQKGEICSLKVQKVFENYEGIDLKILLLGDKDSGRSTTMQVF